MSQRVTDHVISDRKKTFFKVFFEKSCKEVHSNHLGQEEKLKTESGRLSMINGLNISMNKTQTAQLLQKKVQRQSTPVRLKKRRKQTWFKKNET